jgi:hypothetical protein
VVPITSAVPTERKIISFENVNFDLLFIPHWAGDLYKNGKYAKVVDDFISETGAKFFGVASTMYDLEMLSKKTEWPELRHTDKWPSWAADYEDLLGGSIINIGIIGEEIKRINNTAIVSNWEEEVWYKKIEEDIKTGLHRGLDLNKDVLNPALQHFRNTEDEDGMLTVLKEFYKRNAEVRKKLYNIILGEGWENNIINGIETTFMNFGYIAGWDKDDMEIQVGDRNRVKLSYKNEDLKTKAFSARGEGLYGVLFEVPNELIDSRNPLKAGIEVENGMLCYLANVVTMVGGRPMNRWVYEGILPMVATGSGFGSVY